MRRRCILVTGANGFIGTNLVKQLLSQGNQVIALDKAEPRYLYSDYRCSFEMCGQKDFDLLMVYGDIRNYEMLWEKIFSRYEIDYLVHLAALSTIQMGTKDAEETMSVNVLGTETLLRLVKEYKKMKGFLYASTDKVYGKLQKAAYQESDLLNPINSPYDRSKAQADKMVSEWSVKCGIHGIVLRFCNVYGEYDVQTTRIIPGAINSLLTNGSCTLRVYRDKEGHIRNYKREFIYVGDLCEWIWNIIRVLDVWNQEADVTAAKWGEAFNLGVKQCCSMDEVLWRIEKLAGINNSLRIEESVMIPEIEEQCMDYSKTQKYFNYQPKISFENGLQKTIIWWKQKLGEEIV